MVKGTQDFFELGSKICQAGINLEEQLVELLKVQIKALKTITSPGKKVDFSNIDKINTFNKTIIMALMMADDQIKKGIEMCKLKDSNEKE